MSNENLVHSISLSLQILIDGKKTEKSRSAAKSKEEAFIEDLQHNIDLVIEKIQTNPALKTALGPYLECLLNNHEVTSVSKFVEWCLVLLKLITDALIEEESEKPSPGEVSPRGLLSISQQKTVKNCLQFIVALGILPNLIPGISIPMEQRSEYANLLQKLDHGCSPQFKYYQLVVCVQTLLQCLKQDTLQSLILTYHTRDILGALFQLCYAPIKKLHNDQNSISLPGSNNFMTHLETTNKNRDLVVFLTKFQDCSKCTDVQLIYEMWEDRIMFTPMLEKLLKQICPSLLMWELLLLQGMSGKNPKEPTGRSSHHKIPVWMKKLCNQLLTDLILERHGVAKFIHSVLDKASDIDMEAGIVDKVKIEAVSQLITGNPIRHLSLEAYMKKISNQVFELLHVKGSTSDTLLNYIASSIILQFCDLNIKLAEQCFFNILVKPLYGFRKASLDSVKDGECIINEEELTMCVNDMHQIFILGSSVLSQKFIKLLLPFCNCLFSMFYFMQSGKSFLRPILKELLLAILTWSSSKDAISLLTEVTFFNGNSPAVDFAYGDSGGIMVIKISKEIVESLFQSPRCEATLEILQELPNKKIKVSYFLLLLKKLTTSFADKSTSPIGDVTELKNSILTLSLLQKISETIGEDLITDIAEAVGFIKTILENGEAAFDENESHMYGNETLMMALIILSSLTEYKNQLTSTHWSALKECLPGLKKVQARSSDLILKNMAEGLSMTIATHGVVPQNLQEQAPKVKSAFPNDILTLKSPTKKTFCVIKKMQDITKDNVPKAESKYEKFMQDLKHPDIPIRGHALICLGNLLKKKDMETLSHKKNLLAVFQENLVHEDSYIYLPSVQGLSLLAEVDIELVLPVVLSEFQNSTQHKLVVLKLGEVLLKINCMLGDLIVKYKTQLLHTYLTGAKHEEPEIRSSSLSNLGQACKLLKYSLEGHWLQEILVCVQSLLKTDPDLHVRRSAAMVITLLLQGIGKDIFKVLEREIKELYSLVKHVYNTENDEILHLHSQLALEEINIIVKELFCRKLPITKEIRILY